ncbi:MAG: response regulator [Candidatus Eisenbacteria bacterium]|uniref:Response regulator n=1 Tax=Eiseniibacteriota bacterium TaxID=2212470 RepID=A0A948RWX2_UNCEI|nr:response regulator [Candidatus Eisenbacteria bacterium]MBU1948558.1 response regulator [Candidatus Eisenbacteria bacterium]MBU2691052.1 response regulator [Candidatus Eisenbacteria bacterium]
MNEVFQTHLSFLDDHIGGFLSGKAYLAFGEGGSGKSIMGLQYALGAVKNGEAAVYMVMERPADLIAQGMSLGLGLDPAVKSGRLIFLEYDRDVTSRIMRFGWKPFLEQLEPLRQEGEIRRIVFDPIHPLFAGTTEEGRLRYDLRYLVETLQEWNWTPLFLNDRGATQGHPSFYRVFTEVCYGVFELQDEIENLESNKYLFIHNIRQSSDRMRKIPFQIVADRGIVERSISRPDVIEIPVAVQGKEEEEPAMPTVLFADDDPFVRSILKKALRKEFNIILAEDGAEAVTFALSEKPDVVVLDVEMPRFSGFEVCRTLRARGFDRAIIFISAAGSQEERVKGLSLGANDFITKPFDLLVVQEKIRNASRIRVTSAGPRQQNIPLETLLDTAHGTRLSGAEFRMRLARACEGIEKFDVPIGIVQLNWDAEQLGEDAVQRIHSDLENWSRPEDLMTFNDHNEALVVLNAEGRSGTIAYIRKLRRFWVQNLGPENAAGFLSQIKVSFGIVQSTGKKALTPKRALAFVENQQANLYGDPMFQRSSDGESGDSSTSTGTDG